MVDRLGRRFLLLTSSVGLLICYIVITGLSGTFASTGNSSVGLAVVPMLFIYFGFYDIAYTPLLVAYPTEIWPYALRSKGIAITCIASSAALFFNLFVNPIGLENLQWKYYIVYIVILSIAVGVTYKWYVETRGYSLEEIAIIFDRENAAVKQFDTVGQVEGSDSDSVDRQMVYHKVKV
jgi:MFS family permease